GQGKIPLQLYGDFKNGTISSGFGEFEPCIKGGYRFADVRSILPEQLNESFIEAMEQFGRKIKGFDRADAIVCGVEARTSSPVRIHRDSNTLEGSIPGLYPCGEGAGYAGGITSAAADGIYVAEAIARLYAPRKGGVL
ncbi:MAG: FAD-dependent oxidoreductase, partial [Lachnospiraceae bacterium]|nr:FAD-dependent oxidoreductase [Lachnospiraceae bacterium]